MAVAAALVLSGTPVLPAHADAGGRGTRTDDRRGLWGTLEAWLGGGAAERKEEPKPRVIPGDGVPRDEPAPKAEAWPEAKRVKELTGRRTANATFFQLSDGRVQAEVSTTPVHYRDASGVYQPIDTTVGATTRSGFVKGNATNAYTSLFGARSDRLLRFEVGGRHVELGLGGAARAASPTVDGSTVTYAGVAGGADLVYEVTPRELREKIVLDRAPSGAYSLQFVVRAGGVDAVRRDDGSIAFVPKSGGEPVFVIPAPYMYDAGPDATSPVGKGYSDRVTQTVFQSGSTATITVTADAAWLADPARTYPVTIDPTIRIQPVPTDAQDVEIYSGNTSKNYNDTYQLKVGTDASQRWRTLVKFPLTGVPAGTQLDNAQLQLYYDQTHTTWEYDVALQAHRVTQPWSESTATWANSNANFAAQPAGNMVTVDDGDAGKTSVTGTWPYSANATLTPLAVNGDYRYNNDATTGHTHTWVPTITESGDYQVEVHFVSESDRPTNAPYTVFYSGGSKAYSVDQTGGPNGVWKTLGVHPFVAGTTGKVVLGDVANKAVIADAVRFTRWGAATKKRAISSVWTTFPVRNVVQDWVNGTQANHGFMVKAVDEAVKGRGGPIYEASEYAYENNRRDYNLPKLVLTFGRQGTSVSPPTTITATGAALSWPAYVDPTGANGGGDDIVEYQVHRSVYQTFTPSAATLVAPVGKTGLSYQDTSATPTPTNETDPLKRNFFYYMVAVKTADGQVVPGPTQGVLLPKAGQITKLFRETSANQVPDTTLSAGQPNTNVNVYDGDPYVSPGNNSSYYGDTRGLVKFGNLSGIPAGAQVVDAQLRMWNTYLYPGTDTDEWVDVYRVTRAWNETSATWTRANATTSWTTPGGDFAAGALSGFNGFTNDPEWEAWDVKSAVNTWLAAPSSNHGLLLRQRNEASSTARAMLLASEAAEPLLRPTLQVTYLEPTAASTYHAPATPDLVTPSATYTTPVTLSNPTLTAWAPATWELSYHWVQPDGTEVSNTSNQVGTPLPEQIDPGETVDVAAQIKTPAPSADGNKRTDYLLRWELRNKTTGQWLSAAGGIPPLEQRAAVEEPTSDQLGLEKFYSYAGKSTGAGSTVMNNLYAGNAVWSYNALANPSRGLSTFVRMAYNSADTSDTVAGYGWSLQASSLMRLGTPLDFHPNPNPTTVTLTDGDGTSHKFGWDAGTSRWVHPKGVHLHLQQHVSCGPNTEESRAWSMTRPDRTQFFFDCDGYLSSIEDNNGNVQSFTYEVRRSQNKPTKFLRYITDPTGRQSLTIDYWAKGDTFDYIDDITWAKVTGVANLTNPHIIDHVRSVTDISGRTLRFTYTDKGLLGEMVDGAGSAQPKRFLFRYDMTQGNKNVKLVRVTDPRGNPTLLDYYSRPEDDPKFKWQLKTITDRLGHSTTFGYTDPDGPQGNTIHTAVLDAENHATLYQMDGFGRPTQATNAKNQTTRLDWDTDHNVVRLEEANGAVSTWAYDTNTGYPTEIKDAEAVANGWPGTRLTYQTGLNGHIADLIAKQSPEGRTWTFGYTTEGDLASVTDPIGNTTPTTDDYTTSYTYDTWGLILTETDPNGNTTTNSDFDDNGYPRAITDPLGEPTRFEYDVRGNVTKVTDPLGHDTTQTYDPFGRPLVNKIPVDQAAGRFITTPAPTYDANDNIVVSAAPNGAITTAVFDPGDRLVSISAPVDEPGDPQRATSFTYDRVGNLLTTTEPNGGLTADPTDYRITRAYDETYQVTSITNTASARMSFGYDDVGNLTEVVDPRKNATADPMDYTTRYAFDRAHRVTATTDALGETTTSTYDRDGLVTSATDQLGNTTEIALDARGNPIEVRVPHEDNGGISYRVTRYEYDQAGNRTKVVTPRGVATTDDVDDFTHVTVYDQLNRVNETLTAYDPDDPRHNAPDRTTYGYDAAGRLTALSAPPSSGETVRNDTTYTYFDNGWTRTSTDPWDIVTSYDYDELGDQTLRTLTSAGGSSSRTMTSQFHPDGKLKARADDGVPVGRHVVLVDNSDTQNVTATGTWPTGTSAADKFGHNYATHAAGTGANTFSWTLNVPQAGTYEVFARYPTVSGAADNAKYTVRHGGGSTVRTVNQTANAGSWVSLGSYAFTEGNSHEISLSDEASGGTVVADAVKLVRDNTGETDAERHDYTFRYDPNGNLTKITDASPGASVDSYDVTYTGLNQVEQVREMLAGVVKNTTTYQYDENGAPKSVAHDEQHAAYEYDARNLVERVTNGSSETDPDPKVTTYTYTDRGERLRETKGNDNTVDYTYFLDGMLKSQVERKPGGTLVSDHAMEYDLNGNRTRDVTQKMNADNHAAYLTTTTDYSYDPRDRIAQVTKTGDGAGTETYVHDANSNVINQTVKGVTTTYNYDRNRLLSAVVDGTPLGYNYDPFGRLDMITAADAIVERNVYDGFDHLIENRREIGGGPTVTRYTFDPLDRTTTKTTDAGTAEEKATAFTYLGLSGDVLDEIVNGEIAKSYQYSPWGERLSQVVHGEDGSEEDAFFGYSPHTDVETLTDDGGDTKATYGYTAYGSDEDAQFTGVDKPDPADPTKDPYSAYRFNAKRWDPASGNYDMGFRDYSPGLNRFLTRDMYNGALDDLNLALDPWTGNRYAFVGGNPVSGIEIDGHDFCWRCAGEFAMGAKDGWDNWGVDLVNSVVAFVDDPGAVLESMTADAMAWNAELNGPANGSTGWFCVLTGVCDIVKNIAEGNYYEAGYDTGGLALDLTLAAATAPIGGGGGIATRIVGSVLKGVPTPKKPTIPRILQNKAIGDAVADAISSQYPGARREVTLQATSGTRRIDILTPNGLAIESKVGRTSLTNEVRQQIQRDIELMNDPTSGVTRVEWHFTTSPSTGLRGPTGPLLQELQRAGITVVLR
jgi:RHS repeat-associated protein